MVSVVDQRDAVPQQVAALAGDHQGALADGEPRCGANPRQAGSLLAEFVAPALGRMASSVVHCCPLWPTYCRSSLQIGQPQVVVGRYWTPQVTQIGWVMRAN